MCICMFICCWYSAPFCTDLHTEFPAAPWREVGHSQTSLSVRPQAPGPQAPTTAAITAATLAVVAAEVVVVVAVSQQHQHLQTQRRDKKPQSFQKEGQVHPCRQVKSRDSSGSVSSSGHLTRQRHRRYLRPGFRCDLQKGVRKKQQATEVCCMPLALGGALPALCRRIFSLPPSGGAI
jgi:hypothetical protein